MLENGMDFSRRSSHVRLNRPELSIVNLNLGCCAVGALLGYGRRISLKVNLVR
jgi:hypothetical protein